MRKTKAGQRNDQLIYYIKKCSWRKIYFPANNLPMKFLISANPYPPQNESVMLGYGYLQWAVITWFLLWDLFKSCLSQFQVPPSPPRATPDIRPKFMPRRLGFADINCPGGQDLRGASKLQKLNIRGLFLPTIAFWLSTGITTE